MSRWSDLAAQQDAAWRAKGHALPCQRAVQLMPRLDKESARRVRVAMLAGPGSGLREIVSEMNRGAACA